MTKLYELAEQYKELSELSDFDSEMQEAVSTTMDALEGEFNDKAVALVTVMSDLDMYQEGIDDAIKKLQDRKQAIKNRQQGMKDYLRDNMERSGIKKISHPLFTVTLRAGRDMVVVDDEEYKKEIELTKKRNEYIRLLRDSLK